MAWTATQLEKIGDSEELHINSYRADGTLRRWIPIWVVRVDDGVYIRSAYGPESGWYRRALAGTARVQAGGVEADAHLRPIDDADLEQRVSSAYAGKYACMPSALAPMLTEPATSTTVRVDPTE